MSVILTSNCTAFAPWSSIHLFIIQLVTDNSRLMWLNNSNLHCQNPLQPHIYTISNFPRNPLLNKYILPGWPDYCYVQSMDKFSLHCCTLLKRCETSWNCTWIPHETTYTPLWIPALPLFHRGHTLRGATTFTHHPVLRSIAHLRRLDGVAHAKKLPQL